MRKNHHFYTLSTFYTKLKSHTNRKSDTICSFAPHNVCQSLPKPKKPKKTKQHTPTPQIFSIPWVWFFCFFFVFSRFLLLLVESLKKTKKNKKTHPNPPDLLHPMGLVFLFFLVFSRFLLLLVESLKKTKKNKKKHTPTPQTFSIPWVWFFWFSRGFCHFWWKALRKPKNTCITLYKLFNCSNLFHVFISCFSIHYLCLIYPFNHLMTWSGRWPPGAFNLIYLYNLRKMN